MKPFLKDKCTLVSEISLNYENKLTIKNWQKCLLTSLNAVDDLGIKECESDLDLKINSTSSDLESQFKFRGINENS